MAETPEVQLALMAADITRIKTDVSEIKHSVNDLNQFQTINTKFKTQDFKVVK